VVYGEGRQSRGLAQLTNLPALAAGFFVRGRIRAMKVIGVISLVIGAAMFTIWIGTWIAISSERGFGEAVRLGLQVWPGNVAQFVLLALSILFTVGGISLLTAKQEPKK
jgi:hypothetical protein